jgi:hypothetical protein
MDTVPDHPAFSQNRRRRFTGSTIFREIFNRIVRESIETGIVSGETATSDGSFIPANVSWQSKAEITKAAEKSTVDYLEALDEELKKGLGYLAEMTVDNANGIITEAGCYPADRRESSILLKHIEPQTKENQLGIKKLGLDAGYDVGAVHRGLEIMGITGYTSLRYEHNNPMKDAFTYQSGNDVFTCKEGNELSFAELLFKKGTGYYRPYRINPGSCGK